MTINDLRDILDGFVAAGMADSEFVLKLSNDDFKEVHVESATIYKSTDGELSPSFNGWVQNA